MQGLQKNLFDILVYIKDNCLAIITAITALVALWQTHKQTKISNKQFLFDKRLDRYLLTKNLLELYKDNKKLLDYSDNSDEEAIIVDIQFAFLTNTEFLKNITCIIYDVKNNEYKNNFLLKMEELKKLSNEVRFLFNNKNGLYLSNFIFNYQNVLLELYKYQAIINMMIDDKIPRKRKLTYNELQKEYGELVHRYRLYDAIDKLKQSYNEVIQYKVVNKVEKLIKL